jgi:hypothetical protein
MSDDGRRDAPVVEWAVAAQAHPGQDVSGDRHVILETPGNAVAIVIDGLGHGPRAAAAADAAAAALDGHGTEGVAALLRLCHRALRGTRGAVMSLASFDVQAGAMTWLGVGNVMGFLLYAEPEEGRVREVLLVRGGVVGYNLPTLRPVVVPIRPGDTLILATDGVRSSFSTGLDATGPPQKVADRILLQHGRRTDDALVLVARYVGGGG